RRTSVPARLVLPAPLRPSMRTTGFAAARETIASSTAVAAASSAAATGSGLLLEEADDTAERASGDPHERNRDREERDDVRLEAQVVAPADVGAHRDRPPTAAASAVAGFVGASAEARPRECDRDDPDAVDHQLLAVGALHAERRRLLAELECDVGHVPTVPGAVACD